MKQTIKTLFTCQTCGYQTPKWMGKCPDCNQWQTMVEEVQAAGPSPSKGRTGVHSNAPVPLDAVAMEADIRMLTGINEFDRVLGGGLVHGSLVLIGGDPGIGKSTLMLQVLSGLARQGRQVLYVSGEESVRQIRLRSQRLQAVAPNLLVVSETNVDAVVAMADANTPQVMVVDSIQTMMSGDLGSVPGSVSQVREVTLRLMALAKKSGIPVFLVGHVTKDGSIAGPRQMEHMVDTVLYFEGDRNHIYRILRAVKNRFGSTNEIGVFEMKGQGLDEVANPSAVFLSERPLNAPGSVVSASMEGTRPILVELQALASQTSFGTPRRTILGLEPGRVALLVAVMEKKLGMNLLGHDLFMNVTGGVKVDEPAVDLGIAAAVASSFLDRPVPESTLIFGEVGLTGEVRPVAQVDTRVAEAEKLGFSRCILPIGNLRRMAGKSAIQVVGVRTVAEAIDNLF